MKISEIGIENKLMLKFNYKEKEFNMLVDIIKKKNNYVLITAILENEIILDPNVMSNLEVVHSVKEGLYTFKTCKLQPLNYENMRSYAVTCDDDVSKENRREAFRIFIGEICKINITPQAGSLTTLEGIVKNISIYGMEVILNKEIKVGSQMSIVYNFQGLNIHLLGEIVREEKIPNRKSFAYGCKFYGTNPLVNRVIMLKQIKNKRQVQES